jgi:hypothetical protein
MRRNLLSCDPFRAAAKCGFRSDLSDPDPSASGKGTASADKKIVRGEPQLTRPWELLQAQRTEFGRPINSTVWTDECLPN